MNLEKYKALTQKFKMSEQETILFLYNYIDSKIFNDYLDYNYYNIDFNSSELMDKLYDFFEKNNIDDLTKKRIIISSPLIFSCDNFDQQLDIIYKDNKLEGIVIFDKKNNKHCYLLKNNLRSINENKYINDDLLISDNTIYKKSYYIKKDRSFDKQ